MFAVLLVACGGGSNTSEDPESGVTETGITACHLKNGATAVISYNGQGMCWESDGTATPPVQLTSDYFDVIISDKPCDRTDLEYTGCCVNPNVVWFSYSFSSCGKNNVGDWHNLP
ncbi:hypothetical protein M0R72_00830 [Candidatus Pacearchaeota archaeon]|nr:hypothetical protein [Candidatus Pacearchaeota archaeon]